MQNPQGKVSETITLRRIFCLQGNFEIKRETSWEDGSSDMTDYSQDFEQNI